VVVIRMPTLLSGGIALYLLGYVDSEVYVTRWSPFQDHYSKDKIEILLCLHLKNIDGVKYP
jgi:hypothetical protein